MAERTSQLSQLLTDLDQEAKRAWKDQKGSSHRQIFIRDLEQQLIELRAELEKFQENFERIETLLP